MSKALSVRSLRGRWPAFLAAVALLALLGPAVAWADTTPQTLPFTQDWSDTGLIATSDDWSGVPGVMGYRGDNLTGATGTDPQTIVGEGTPVVDVNANQTNPDTYTSGGVTEFEITNPVVALTGSGTADAPYVLISLNTTGKSSIQVDYNLRDIDGSADDAIQQVALQYRVGTTGDFTNLPAGYVADASSGPSLATKVTPVSVTLPGACDNQAVVQIRIITTNAVGNDEWIGIDDISIDQAGPTPKGWLYWHNSSSGENAAWGLDGFSVVAAAALPTVAAPWAPQWAGDFDNDGDPDVLWRNLATGESAVWYLEDGALVSGAVLWTVDTAWVVAAVGDFDGNGYSDILWRKTSTGENALWLVAAGASVTPALLDPTATTWSVAGAGDLDGDGKDDLVWRDAAAGQNAAWIMNGATVASTGMLTDMASNWTLAGVGDIDGDGKDDLIWWDYNADPLVGAGWIMNGLSVGSTGALPQPDNTHWRIQDVQDFDGDGQADVFWRRPSDGENGSWQMDGLNAPTMGLLPLVPDGNWFVFNSGY